MDLLIRITDDAGGNSDIEHSLDKLTLGSAGDSDVQLPLLELRHATLEKGGIGNGEKDALLLRSIARGGVQVNGKLVKRALLQPGDLVELPGATLHIEAAPGGFDGMVQVRRVAGHVSTLATQKLSLEETFLSKRLFAWLGALLVVVGMFVVPLLFSGERAGQAPVANLFSDKVWSSGELHVAHELVTGDNCASCHVAPFERVQNEACVSCHGAIEDHVSSGFLAATGVSSGALDFGANANERCGVCHREHNEPSTLVSDADSDCVQCHAATDGIRREVDPLAAVSGFASGTHPNFEYLLPRFKLADFSGSADEGWHLEAVGEAAIADSPETSELLFPHDIHLDAGEVTDLATGDALTCGSCHTASVDGEHFLPVAMEAHCQDCHQLDFDESDPDRSLPHARLKEAVYALEGMLLKKHFDPDNTGELFAYRKLPDRPERSTGCTDAPEVCVERELKKIVDAQFAGEIGCAACHSFERQDAQDIEDQYWVRPVNLPQDFVPDARFDHSAHQVLRDVASNDLLLGDDACDTCHTAKQSDKATDLLMPAMDTCYQCHGDRDSTAQIALACVDCHAYHPRDFGGNNLASSDLDAAARLWRNPVGSDVGAEIEIETEAVTGAGKE